MIFKTIWREFWTGRKGVRTHYDAWMWSIGFTLIQDWAPGFDSDATRFFLFLGPLQVEFYLEDRD